MPWDPSSGQTFGEWMRGGGELGQQTADVVVGERTWATQDQVVEGRTEEGGRFKAVRDQAGHHVIEETRPSGEQRQHVQINL